LTCQERCDLKGWTPTGTNIVDLLHQFADRLGSTDAGRRFSGAFDAAIQFRWVPTPIDPAEMAWFGTDSGTWACLTTGGGRVEVAEGDRRHEHDWRRCILVESDEETLHAVLEGAVRPLDVYLGDRLHVSHFTVGGAAGQWALALLAFGQPGRRGTGILPGRDEKRFQSYDYHGAVERRRQELLARVPKPVRG